MENCVVPNVVRKFSGVKVELWHWLKEEVGNRDGSFKINQSALAKKFDVTRKSIQNALKTFISANLMEKVESRTGRGNHPLYRLIWTFKKKGEKSATPSRAYSKPQEKNITKGGKPYRYFAYQFRTTVENSTLANKSQIVVGKLLNYLEGKPHDLFKETLTYLKRWLSEEKRTLKGFFAEFFHDILRSIERRKRKLKETKEFIREQKELRAEVRKEYQNDPPPRSKDYDRFSDYLHAIENWES